MATITASSSTSVVARASLVRNTKVGVSSSPVLGLPKMARMGRVSCSMEKKPEQQQQQEQSVNQVGGASLAAVAAAMAVWSPQAMALVDERMSTEGTGLPFGLSNNLLGWILFGVFGVTWAFYTVYTSTIDDDEESGLSL